MQDFYNKKKILAIDDDRTQLLFIQENLMEIFDVVTAMSGKAALEKLYSGFMPDAILLDILMPEMDGWEIFYRINAIGLIKNIPIIFLTGKDGEADKRRAYELGAADFIKKPYEKDFLVNSINVAIAKYLLQQCSA
jgi:putative two-component system response regulator